MTRFSATNRSEAEVAAPRQQIWDVLTDPVLLPQLTPLLRGIEADGDVWRWDLIRISAMGVSIVPSFTEQMVFTPHTRIEYHHAPPAGRRERTGADGWYALSDTDAGTHLAISLTLHVDLPLPRASAPAVRGVMGSMMARTGERFSQNLLKHLGLPPD